MGKLFLSENKFQKINIKWSRPNVGNSMQKGNVRIVFTEIPKDSPEYKEEIPSFEIDPWSPLAWQVMRENYVANVVIDEKIAFACTMNELTALHRALGVLLDRASSQLQ